MLTRMTNGTPWGAAQGLSQLAVANATGALTHLSSAGCVLKASQFPELRQ
jgi:hypothetical protein